MSVDSGMYVCGEPLYEEVSKTFVNVRKGDKVVHKHGGRVFTACSAYFDRSDLLFCVDEAHGWSSAKGYCRAVLKEQPKEESNMEEEQFEWVFANEDKVKFGDLSAEQMKLIVDAYLSYEQVVEKHVIRRESYWAPMEECVTHVSGIYRVKRKVVQTPLDIPWKYIDKKYKYAAMDKNESVWFTDKEPFLGHDCCVDWTSTGLYVDKSTLSIDTTGINWKHSLTKRPEGV